MLIRAREGRVTSLLHMCLLAQGGVHGASHLDADLRGRLLVVVLGVHQRRVVRREALQQHPPRSHPSRHGQCR
jgi:hypothetical protein